MVYLGLWFQGDRFCDSGVEAAGGRHAAGVAAESSHLDLQSSY